MYYFLIPLIAIMGAFGRRVCGGGLNQWFKPNGGRVTGDLPVRLFFGLMVAISFYLGGAPWYIALSTIITIWIGTTIGFFSSLSWGKDGKHTWVHDMFGLWGHGFGGILPTFIIAYCWKFIPGFEGHLYWPLLLAGLLAPFCYWAGWSISGKDGLKTLPPGFKGGTEIAECFYGAIFALTAFFSG